MNESFHPSQYWHVLVITYLLTILLSLWCLPKLGRGAKKEIQLRREKAGLDTKVLIDHKDRLEKFRRAAKSQAELFLLAVFLHPCLMLVFCLFASFVDEKFEISKLLFAEVYALIAVLFWMLYSGSEVIRSFLGGLAFRTLSAVKSPIQVGDRVKLKGIIGTIEEIGIFYVKLVTLDDDQVYIPTAGLWSEVLTSLNGGERSSLCVIHFYIAPYCEQRNLQAAEDTIWEAIQASPYLDFSQPMQIYLSQNPDSIQMTAKAYVASTYNEPIFKSDVTHAFLRFAARRKLPLATPHSTQEIGVPVRSKQGRSRFPRRR